MNFFEGVVDGGKFRTADVTIPLDGYEYAPGGETSGPAWLGFRPEHVSVGDAAAGDAFKAEVKVEIVEPMGSDTLVWTTLAGVPFRFRMDGQAMVKTGDTLSIGSDPARASMFHKGDETRM